MLRIRTVALHGVRPIEVEVEAHIARGMPSFSVVGLASKSVNEAKDRIWAVFDILGLQKPMQKIIVNLGPADLQKEGNHYDVPIALALLVAMGVLEQLDSYIAVGELSLDGRFLPVRGVLPTAIYAESQQLGLICPECCGGEAIWGIEKSKIVAASSLISLINHFKARQILNEPKREIITHQSNKQYPLIENIEGQADAVWGAILGVGGGHNMLMTGHPGVGKTMIANAMHAMMPNLTPHQAIDVGMIYSISDQPQKGIVMTPPFRAPHHTSSIAGLIGGSAKALPGEISLAHNGILFLDEFPEFDRRAIESLRLVLESGEITIVRAQYRVSYPAEFILVAAMNPCPCGYLGNTKRECSKVPRCGEQYMHRISGPILDRFDMVISVKHPKHSNEIKKYKTTEEAKFHIARIRAIQAERFKEHQFKMNGKIPGGMVRKFVDLTKDAEDILNKFVDKWELSIRGRDRVLRLARTIGDFSEHGVVQIEDILEALSYRQELALKG